MASEEAQKVFMNLRNCKFDGLLRDSLMLDFKRGSKFQKLEWAGDRHLKSLLASQAMLGVGRLKDEGELSELCSRCESNANLANLFDEMQLEKLVDQGGAHVEQFGGIGKRKADIIEAVVGELKSHMDQGGSGSQARKAEDALKDLVTLIFLRGDRPQSVQCAQVHALACHPTEKRAEIKSACLEQQRSPVVAKRPSELLPGAEEKTSKKAREAIAKLQWVKVGSGQLAARGKPSHEQLAALKREKGLTAIVTLLRQDEAGCSDVEHSCRELELHWKHAPFDGLKDICGDNLTAVVWQSLLSTRGVANWLKRGENVIVHCAAGLHRTGIYLYLLLRVMGCDQRTALESIQGMRRETHEELTSKNLVKTAEQIFVQFSSHQHNIPTRVEAPKALAHSTKADQEANPISRLNQYAQKNKLQLVFKEESSQAEGFRCCAALSGKWHKWSPFITKKQEAKAFAATLALIELGL